MAEETRIYEVNQEGKKPRLVECASQAQARNHVSRGVIAVTIPTTKRVAELYAQGITAEKPGATAPATDPA